MPEPIIKVRTYVVVCALLVLLTVLTVGLSFWQVAVGWHIVMGLTIAACKASLVVLFFMHALASPALDLERDRRLLLLGGNPFFPDAQRLPDARVDPDGARPLRRSDMNSTRPTQVSMNPLGLLSMVLGAIGMLLFFMPILGLPLSALGLLFGLIGILMTLPCGGRGLRLSLQGSRFRCWHWQSTSAWPTDRKATCQRRPPGNPFPAGLLFLRRSKLINGYPTPWLGQSNVLNRPENITRGAWYSPSQ